MEPKELNNEKKKQKNTFYLIFFHFNFVTAGITKY